MKDNISERSVFREKKLFLIGCVIGALLFVWAFGTRVLDVTYDEWIFGLTDPDIEQHYLGWCHFRVSDWTFPLGMMNRLSYPYEVSVLYTDSIPIWAFFFKIFRSVLPETFQYLGWYGLVSLALMGGFSALLIKRVTGNDVLSVMGTPFFALSFPIIQRMFYHTTLTAQWMLVAAILLWLEEGRYGSFMKGTVVWTVFSVLVMMTHPYLWAMSVGVLCFALLDKYLDDKDLKKVIIRFSSLVISGAASLFVMGAFSKSLDSEDFIGQFEGNFNAFINPLKYGSLIKELPLQDGFQYEGFGYLGCGMFILLFAAVVLVIAHVIKRGKKVLSVKYLFKNHRRWCLALMAGICYALFSFFPKVAINDHLLFRIPLTKWMQVIVGYFRSNGRFVWVAVYLIYAFAFWAVAKYGKELIGVKAAIAAAYALTLLCLLVQARDMRPYLSSFKAELSKEFKPNHCDLDDPVMTANIDHYSHIVMTYDDQIEDMDYAHYAYKHGLTMNRFYFARSVSHAVKAEVERVRSDAEKGQLPSDYIVLLNEENYYIWKDYPVNIYKLDGTWVAVKEPVPGLDTYSD